MVGLDPLWVVAGKAGLGPSLEMGPGEKDPHPGMFPRSGALNSPLPQGAQTIALDWPGSDGPLRTGTQVMLEILL